MVARVVVVAMPGWPVLAVAVGLVPVRVRPVVPVRRLPVVVTVVVVVTGSVPPRPGLLVVLVVVVVMAAIWAMVVPAVTVVMVRPGWLGIPMSPVMARRG